jgi:hypothetical protein
MTVSELYRQVASLGYESSLESNEIFYDAARRAILEVNRVRPRMASVLIDHVSPENLTEDVFTPRYVMGELEFIGMSPRCVYFEANGNGRVFFETCEEDNPFYEREIRHEGEGFTEHRILLEKKEGLVRMRIAGDYVFSVRNVAMYEHLWGPSEDDVPKRASYRAYDMRDIAPDFLEFNSPPVSEEEEYIKPAGDYRVEEGTKLLLAHDKPGVYKVLYKRLPKGIDTDEPPNESDEVIDLDEEIAALLPPLIAAYVYAEDEPDLAEYYLSLYRQNAAEIRAAAKSPGVVRTKNVTGW